MQTVDCVIETPVSQSLRCKQLESVFDVPPQEKAILKWRGEIPIDEFDWGVGLIVGPSGSGKSTLARHLFGKRVDREPRWTGESVIDSFKKKYTVSEIAKVLSSVGFNTIPAWLRPYRVLSTGEKFRAMIARRQLEGESPIVVDEFTSVVDRQVAKITSHAVQKYVRRRPGMRFVAVSCHRDIVDWLQPDWVLSPDTMEFQRRRLRRRPKLRGTVSPVPYSAWGLFAPYHYLTSSLHRSARCWGLFAESELVAFCGVVHRTHPKRNDLKGVSRLVTLPDWQGLGLAFILAEKVAAVYEAVGFHLRTYPAHPMLVRAFDRSPRWYLAKKPGVIQIRSQGRKRKGAFGNRPCACFQYAGDAIDEAEARRVLSYWS